MKRSLPFAIIVLGLAGALVFGLYLSRSAGSAGAATSRENPLSRSNEPLVTTGAEPAHVRGSATTAITLEEFADFECPACGKFYPVLKQIESEYGARISVVFREFPLMQHVHAMPAARAAEAAGLQGRFWEMHDMLYEDRENWTKADDVQTVFEEYARKLGLDVEQFKKDQKSDVVQKRIALDHQRGRFVKLRSTPTLYLNGNEIPFAQMKTVEELRKVVERALPSETQQ